MTVREPRFTEQDHAELIALAVYREGLCPLCGRPRSQCSPDDESIPDFHTTSVYCHAAVSQVEAANAASSSSSSDKYARARLWITRKR